MITNTEIEFRKILIEIGFDLSEFEEVYKNKFEKILKKITIRKLALIFLLPLIISFVILMAFIFLIGIIYHSFAASALTLMISFFLNIFGMLLISSSILLLRLEISIKELINISLEFINRVVVIVQEKEKNLKTREIIEGFIYLIIIPNTTRIIKRTFKFFGRVISRKVFQKITKVMDDIIELIELKPLKIYINTSKEYYYEKAAYILGGEINIGSKRVGILISNFFKKIVLVNIKRVKIKEEETGNSLVNKIDEVKKSSKIAKIYSGIIGKLKNIRRVIFLVGMILLSIEIIQIVLLFLVINGK